MKHNHYIITGNKRSKEHLIDEAEEQKQNYQIV